MRPTRMPLGRSRSSAMSPTGSAIAAICSQPTRDGLERGASSVSRSTSGAARPAVARRGDVAGIGLAQRRVALAQAPRQRAQRGVAGRHRRAGERAARRRAPAFPCARRSPAGRPRSWPTLFQSRPREGRDRFGTRAGRRAPGGARLAVSDARGIGLGRLVAGPTRVARQVERHERARRVEVDQRVELARQAGVEVVALALGLGPVDDADRALAGAAPRARSASVALPRRIRRKRGAADPWKSAS